MKEVNGFGWRWLIRSPRGVLDVAQGSNSLAARSSLTSRVGVSDIHRCARNRIDAVRLRRRISLSLGPLRHSHFESMAPPPASTTELGEVLVGPAPTLGSQVEDAPGRPDQVDMARTHAFLPWRVE